MLTPMTEALTVNQHRLMANLWRLAQIGRLPSGGVQRLAFSPEDCQARALVQRWMQEAGMTVLADAAGNMVGHYPGRRSDVPALATGSHLDTVPNGGHYDGAYGVLAGIEAVRVLASQGTRLDHPIEVIVFSDEERTMLGCKALSGRLLADPEQYQGRGGESVETCLERVGGSWQDIFQVQRRPGSIAAFVELHVEQGPVLEAIGKQIGVVTGIVGQRRYWITVEGKASHAGTTPMPMRQDALVTAAEVALAINRIGGQPGDQVATVGQLDISPNAPNSIPGQVKMSLDIRDLDRDRLDALMAQVQSEIQGIAAQSNTNIRMEQCLDNEPAPAKEHIQSAIVSACQALQLSYLYLPSRASHDAQEMARITDMGMIFVPSEGGISHSEQEYTSPAACAQGANVLLHTLMSLDRYYD